MTHDTTPRVGDRWIKTPARTGRQHKRTVTKVDDRHVTYRDRNLVQRVCTIKAWHQWVANATKHENKESGK